MRPCRKAGTNKSFPLPRQRLAPPLASLPHPRSPRSSLFITRHSLAFLMMHSFSPSFSGPGRRKRFPRSVSPFVTDSSVSTTRARPAVAPPPRSCFLLFFSAIRHRSRDHFTTTRNFSPSLSTDSRSESPGSRLFFSFGPSSYLAFLKRCR